MHTLAFSLEVEGSPLYREASVKPPICRCFVKPLCRQYRGFMKPPLYNKASYVWWSRWKLCKATHIKYKAFAKIVDGSQFTHTNCFSVYCRKCTDLDRSSFWKHPCWICTAPQSPWELKKAPQSTKVPIGALQNSSSFHRIHKGSLISVGKSWDVCMHVFRMHWVLQNTSKSKGFAKPLKALSNLPYIHGKTPKVCVYACTHTYRYMCVCVCVKPKAFHEVSQHPRALQGLLKPLQAFWMPLKANRLFITT